MCPSIVVGDIHEQVGGSGGFLGGLIAGLCCPCCIMAFDAPKVSQRAGFSEDPIKSCLCTLCPCTQCFYIDQVWREIYIDQVKLHLAVQANAGRQTTTWSTGFFECDAYPLCFALSCVCPAILIGDIHQRVHAHEHSFFAGLLLGCCCPCVVMALDAPIVAQKAGFEESPITACLCSSMPCTEICYVNQVWREAKVQEMKPVQIQME